MNSKPQPSFSPEQIRLLLDNADPLLKPIFSLKAEVSWRHINGSEKLEDLIDGVVFVDGERKKAA